MPARSVNGPVQSCIATGRVGVNFGPNFAVEGEGTFGVKDDGGTELDSELGLFAVGKLPVNPSFEGQKAQAWTQPVGWEERLRQ